MPSCRATYPYYLDRERFALFKGAPRVAHEAKREGVTEPARVQALSHYAIKIVFAQRVMSNDLPVIDGRRQPRRPSLIAQELSSRHAAPPRSKAD